MKNFSQKLILITSVILSFLLADFSVAATAKTDSKSSTNEVEDQDLKLSIEELKKKYPIDWLNKKYGSFDKYCYCDDFHSDCPKSPKNLVCTFYVDPSRFESFEDAKKVSLADFSESELKSVFVNYEQRGSDERILQIVDVFVDYFMKKDARDLNVFDKKILKFVFSAKVTSQYKIGCANASKYLGGNFCNKRDIPIKDRQENEEKLEPEIKQKFQTLFFSNSKHLKQAQ